MAILAFRVIFGIFFGVPILVYFAMNTFGQKRFHIRMRKFFLARRFDNMASCETVDFFDIFMGNFFDVRMTFLTLGSRMNTIVLNAFVNEQELHLAVFINSAQSRKLMT